MQFRKYLETLTEAKLSVAELKKHEWRIDTFREKIDKKTPFTLLDGTEIILPKNKNEDAYNKLVTNLSSFGKGSKETKKSVFIDTKGNTYKLTQFLKTPEFGGGSSGKVKIAWNVKPQSFEGICDVELTLKQLIQKLDKSIKKRTDLPNNVKNYLLKSIYQKATNEDWDVIDVGKKDIIKDFGEILGAIILINGNYFGKNPKIKIPSSGKEPIIDYYLINNKKVFNISAKSKTSKTNTLKLNNLLEFINKKNYNKNLIKIIQIIIENKTVQAPILIYDYIYKTKYSKHWKKLKGTQLKNKLTDEDIKHYKKLIQDLELDAKRFGDIFYYTERHIMKYINNKFGIDIANMFIEAIEVAGIYYVILDITSNTPNGNINLKESKQFKKSKLSISSGNSRNRAGDKLGIQM